MEESQRTDRDPAKDAYVEQTVRAQNHTGALSPGFIIAGGFMIVAFSFFAFKQDETSALRASILEAPSVEQQQKFDEAIRLIRDEVDWAYDSGEWQALPSPVGTGTAVVMSKDFVWYVDSDKTLYVVNGLAKTLTPDLEYAKDLSADEVFAVLGR